MWHDSCDRIYTDTDMHRTNRIAMRCSTGNIAVGYKSHEQSCWMSCGDTAHNIRSTYTLVANGTYLGKYASVKASKATVILRYRANQVTRALKSSLVDDHAVVSE
jgi:hypothetical protein